MKFSFTKNPEVNFFIKNPNLTKKKKISGRREGRVCDYGKRFFFSNESKSEKKIFFGGVEGKTELASVSEFVLPRIQI